MGLCLEGTADEIVGLENDAIIERALTEFTAAVPAAIALVVWWIVEGGQEAHTRDATATVRIREATARRVYAEQQFVNALESYTKSLQTGLRMVNKLPPQRRQATGIS